MNKEERKQYNREYQQRNKIKLNSYHKSYSKEHPEFKLRQHVKEKLNYPEKVNAWKSDYKKRKKECQICKSNEDLEFHHTNYKKHEGITLCRRCHRNLHNTTKKGVKNGNN
jgi:hypothetical protein